jgi:aconitate decarboxylase
MSHAAYHHGWWKLERPLTPIGAQMNVAYAVAVAIIDGAAMVKQFSPQRIDSDDVWTLIPKITAHHDPEFDKGGPSGRNTRMTVHLKDGSSLQQFIAVSRTISQPLSNEQVVAKYRTLTNGLVEPKRQAAIEDLILNLEKLRGITELSNLLSAPVESAF